MKIVLTILLLALSGCTPICSDCMKLDAMQKKQLDYLPTPPAKQDRTIWTGVDVDNNQKTGPQGGRPAFLTPGTRFSTDVDSSEVDERIRRATVQLVIEPIQWIEPETFDPDGSWVI